MADTEFFSKLFVLILIFWGIILVIGVYFASVMPLDTNADLDYKSEITNVEFLSSIGDFRINGSKPLFLVVSLVIMSIITVVVLFRVVFK